MKGMILMEDLMERLVKFARDNGYIHYGTDPSDTSNSMCPLITVDDLKECLSAFFEKEITEYMKGMNSV